MASADRESVHLDEYKKFADMKLDENLVESLKQKGLEEPSKIQQKVIVPIIKGHDMLIGGAAGIGNTVAINTALVQILLSRDREPNKCQAIVLCPTRELAMNTRLHFTSLSESVTDLKSVAFVGGTSVRENIETAAEGVDIIFGTPGRVTDLITWRNVFDVDSVKVLVLDEADELMSRGFKDAIVDMRKLLKDDVQVIVSTPVVSPWVKEVADEILRDPIVCRF